MAWELALGRVEPRRQLLKETYKVGTVVVDMYDPKDKQLIWRGMSSDTLSDKPEDNEKKLAKAVSKTLKDFPPKGKG